MGIRSRIGLALLGRAQQVALSGAARRFKAALQRPDEAQRRILLGILERNAETEYGRAHGFASIRTPEEYARAVPAVAYDDLEPHLARMRAGETDVLTSEALRAFEPTSGSSSAAVKTIPYTPSLLAEYREALGAWMHDLNKAVPGLVGRPAYWAISPGGPTGQRTDGGVPLGLSDDTEYLGAVSRLATGLSLAVPGEVSAIEDMDACRRTTADHLLACRDLAFISVWSPTFLTLLMDCIEERRPGFRADQAWPKLAMISCWTDGAAARFLPALRERFPGVPIQGKGLLATEGIVSIPMVGLDAPPLAVTSHFLEFVAADDPQGAAWTVEQLEEGREYSPLLTTGGGLYRYRLGDRIRVEGFAGRTPLVRFMGRLDGGCDLCGDKLTPQRVEQALDEVRTKTGQDLRFALVAPELEPAPHYVLYAEPPPGDALDPALSEALDEQLRLTHHYDRCRQLGQLGPVVVAATTQGARRYEAACMDRGMKAGDIKPTLLHPATDWARWMR